MSADPVADDAPKNNYLHEIDMVRLLTFASVIWVHAIAQSTTPYSQWGNAFEVIVHFTRDAFFAITGFVLFHTNYKRPLDVKRFWLRRFPVVFIPYVVWTSIYYWVWFADESHMTTGKAINHYLYDLLTGSAAEHLYFLLVSMQVYLFFPLLRKIVQKTTGHHLLLFTGLFIYNIMFLAWLHYDHRTGAMATFANNCQELIISYPALVFGGALCAVHMDKFKPWIRKHAALVTLGAPIGLAIAMAVYLINIHHHGDIPNYAAEPLQPAIMIWSISIVLVLYVIGLAWARKRTNGSRAARFVSEASTASFGVYLVHPLFLLVAMRLGFGYELNDYPPVVEAVGGWVIAVVLSSIFVQIFMRTPWLSMPLTGRYYKAD